MYLVVCCLRFPTIRGITEAPENILLLLFIQFATYFWSSFEAFGIC